MTVLADLHTGFAAEAAESMRQARERRRHRDIVVTWPKAQPLGYYLTELVLAERRKLVINYRVANLPRWDDAIEGHDVTSWPYGVEHPRCFMVHDGYVRGWCRILYTCRRGPTEVKRVESYMGFWPAGNYIVRSPEWHELDRPIAMKGFQGWRWFEHQQ